MTNICLCSTHKEQITNSSNDDLTIMLSQQLTIKQQIDQLIKGMEDCSDIMPALYDGSHAVTWVDSIKIYKSQSINTGLIIEILKEEITKRLPMESVNDN